MHAHIDRVQRLTGVPVTNLPHDLGGAFDVYLHARALKPLDNDTHAAQSRDEFEGTNDTQFQEVSVL